MGPIPNSETKQRMLVAKLEGAETTVSLTATADGKLNVESTLEVGDVEIGAVEIKNDSTDDRANVQVRPTRNELLVNDDNIIKTWPTQGKVTVTNGAGGVQILAANSARRFATIVNPSSNRTLWLKFGDDAGGAAPAPIVGEGTPVFPGGVCIIDKNNLIRGQIKGISDGTTNIIVAVTEGIQ
jgi:hypothetical protein